MYRLQRTKIRSGFYWGGLRERLPEPNGFDAIHEPIISLRRNINSGRYKSYLPTSEANQNPSIRKGHGVSDLGHLLQRRWRLCDKT